MLCALKKPEKGHFYSPKVLIITRFYCTIVCNNFFSCATTDKMCIKLSLCCFFQEDDVDETCQEILQKWKQMSCAEVQVNGGQYYINTGCSQNQISYSIVHTITVVQGYSQDFRIGCPKIHVCGELGVQFCFIPLHYTQKNMDIIRVSKFSIRVSKRHPDAPLAKGLL